MPYIHENDFSFGENKRTGEKKRKKGKRTTEKKKERKREITFSRKKKKNWLNLSDIINLSRLRTRTERVNHFSRCTYVFQYSFLGRENYRIIFFSCKNENPFRWNVLRIFMLTDKRVIFIRHNYVFSNIADYTFYCLSFFFFLRFPFYLLLFFFLFFFSTILSLSSIFFVFFLLKNYILQCAFFFFSFRWCTLSILSLDSIFLFYEIDRRDHQILFLRRFTKRKGLIKRFIKKDFRSTLYNYHNSLRMI